MDIRDIGDSNGTLSEPLPHSQSSLVPSLVTIIHHPESQKLAFTGL